MSGEPLAVVDDYEGKTVKDMKKTLAALIGISRFRQKLLSEDGLENPDDEVLASTPLKLQLVMLEFLPSDPLEDQRMMAASGDNDSRMLEELLQCPRNPNMMNLDGNTPLHRAAEHGCLEAIGLLLEAGAMKDALTTEPEAAEGWTPLLFAAENGHFDCIRVLVDARVDINKAAKDDGSSALYLAAREGPCGSHLHCYLRPVRTETRPPQTMEKHLCGLQPARTVSKLLDCCLKLVPTETRPRQTMGQRLCRLHLWRAM